MCCSCLLKSLSVEWNWKYVAFELHLLKVGDVCLLTCSVKKLAKPAKSCNCVQKLYLKARPDLFLIFFLCTRTQLTPRVDTAQPCLCVLNFNFTHQTLLTPSFSGLCPNSAGVAAHLSGWDLFGHMFFKLCSQKCWCNIEKMSEILV